MFPLFHTHRGRFQRPRAAIPARRSHRYRPVLEFLERRELLASDMCAVPEGEPPSTGAVPLTAAVVGFDINGDGHISPIDVLLLVNQLNGVGPDGELVAPGDVFGDVDEDGYLTPQDLDPIVDYLSGRDVIALPGLVPDPPYFGSSSLGSPLDVDHSGTVDATDALMLQAFLNEPRTSGLPDSVGTGGLDLNRDGHVTSLDLLLVVNELEGKSFAFDAECHLDSATLAGASGVKSSYSRILWRGPDRSFGKNGS